MVDLTVLGDEIDSAIVLVSVGGNALCPTIPTHGADLVGKILLK